MNKDLLLLTINPGSTSTKIALYQGEKELSVHVLRHSVEELSKYETPYEQKDFRLAHILDYLKESGVALSDIDVFVGRGGLLHPHVSGTYDVNEQMLVDLKSGKYGHHASTLGGVLAHELALKYGKPSYVVDSPCVDELSDVARITGIKKIKRVSVFHALNQKAIAKQYAKDIGKKYDELDLIVIHLGGGISIGWHHLGSVVDVNNALNGDGPIAPERSGAIPAQGLVDLCFSGEYTKAQIAKLLAGKGGLVDLIGTADGREIEQRYNAGDPEVVPYVDAMIYSIIKQVGGLYFAAGGKIDAIVATGGMARDKNVITALQNTFEKFTKFVIYPGEDEMRALAFGALRVINGEEEVKHYAH